MKVKSISYQSKARRGKQLITKTKTAERSSQATQHPNITAGMPEIQEFGIGYITIEKTVTAVNKLMNNEAPGMDGIHPEMIEQRGRYVTESPRRMWDKEKVSEEWKIRTIITIPKKDCSNWRGISLLSISSKVL